ncbi:hypothetical protein M406DRAFT_336663 [Cryphonectria parasitica EP155]|uniref:Serine hydrolase domain-containing protein n=1 Tax=Cryphonectria parasitica (strain ATCC 38755 / EP155) TaxID=660469 RepID=A0A9P5CVJ5_CRYP1|nr:uncharacterized protein M406DRAFT_336663 [Cryphonectria parasitica EP155]KAF3771156.1 hypothetical protein M406DRAFT_336663 [Cryphonectria parasitica EP155]
MTVSCDSEQLRLPRILCLHGGGSNARVFRAQCRSITVILGTHFRFVFVDAPFLSQAGPCVLSVYNGWGPFRRWLRWTDDHPEMDAAAATAAIEKSIQLAIEQDDALGATGEVVALLGFSQGAKMAASMLYRQQVRMMRKKKEPEMGLAQGTNAMCFRFGVLLAGRGPLVAMDPEFLSRSSLPDTSALSGVDSGYSDVNDKGEHTLHIPTLHVHGLQDPGINCHRRLYERYCDGATTRLVEWNGDHRVPIKTCDVIAVVGEIMSLARQTGVLGAWNYLEVDEKLL